MNEAPQNARYHVKRFLHGLRGLGLKPIGYERHGIGMAKSVRLADIAKRLNVSTVTVSKALSDQKGVSEEMREKIKRLAQEMGYRSPSEARKAAAGRSYNVGVIVSDRYLDQYESFYWQMYQAVATRAVSRECFTMLEVLDGRMERNLVLPKLLRESKAEGLIILGLLDEDYLDAIVQDIDIPFICMDFYDKKLACDAVITDSFYGTYKLTNYLFEMEHTEIAYVGTLLCTGNITDRYFGYSKALLEHGQQVRPEWVMEDRNPLDGLRSDGFRFKLPKQMPTAFVCSCDLTAGLLINQLQQDGYTVPEDISVVGFDNYIHPGICGVGITTYAVDMKGMAEKTISSLIKKMNGEPCQPGISIIEGSMIIKDSVRRRPCSLHDFRV